MGFDRSDLSDLGAIVLWLALGALISGWAGLLTVVFILGFLGWADWYAATHPEPPAVPKLPPGTSVTWPVPAIKEAARKLRLVWSRKP